MSDELDVEFKTESSTVSHGTFNTDVELWTVDFEERNSEQFWPSSSENESLWPSKTWFQDIIESD